MAWVDLRMLSATEIVSLHDRLNQAWHAEDDGLDDGDVGGDWLRLVARQHRANFDLWHIEDEARTPGATHAELAGVKRRIDQTNQRRNDLAEQLDRALLEWLSGVSGGNAGDGETDASGAKARGNLAGHNVRAEARTLHVSDFSAGDVASGDESAAGAKAPDDFEPHAARLKSCPDTPASDEKLVQTGNDGLVQAGSEEFVQTGDQKLVQAGNEQLVQTGSEEFVQTGSDGLVQTGNEQLVQTGSEEFVQTGSEGSVQAGNEGFVQTGNQKLVQAGNEGLVQNGINCRLPNPDAPLHSESPGLIIDRLSILGLKIYHTREEAERAEAPAGHAERNRERLAILEEQRADLAHCLDQLWRDTLAGTRRFKLYRQLKMYNDPSLNPAVYRKLVKEQAG
jgi:hypothetical protein